MSFDFDFRVDQLEELLVGNQYTQDWFDALYSVLPEYEINTLPRVAAFIAQCGHESANFKVLKENLNYRWESLRKVFPKYFPTDAIAKQYASKPNKQEAIANRVYANRMGNGPETSGDGYAFCGRGLIQLTGHDNYQLFADSIGMGIDEVPDYLGTFEGAVKSACWFWDTRNLNQYADSEDLMTLTKRINGGTHGLDDRIDRYNKAINILGS